MGSDKVQVAIFDNDNKIRTLKKYEVSEDGTKIRIVSGGEGHFMPVMNSTSFLEFPSRKRYLVAGPRSWDRIYFVKNKGKRCVDFSTEEVFGPSPEESKKAIGASLLEQIGERPPPFPIWLIYLILLILIGIAGKVFGVIG